MASLTRRASAVRSFLRRRTRPYRMELVRHFRGRGVLPDFLIAGAMKSGTTSLFLVLCQHPGILQPRAKEVQFFSVPANHARGEEWYRAFFPAPAAVAAMEAELGYRPLTGEATPAMSLRAYAEGAATLLPDARLIMTFRNPVDRAYSHYQHMRRAALPERRSFEDALQSELALLEEGIRITRENHPQYRRPLHKFGYLNRGYYAEQLEYWLLHFPREQLLVLNFDAWKHDVPSAAAEVADFLGLPPYDFQPVRSNEGGYREQMSASTREWLTEHYRPHNRRLFELLGEDWGWAC